MVKFPTLGTTRGFSNRYNPQPGEIQSCHYTASPCANIPLGAKQIENNIWARGDMEFIFECVEIDIERVSAANE